MILLHGGNFFSSGNDLSLFHRPMNAETVKLMDTMVNDVLFKMLMSMARSVKPIVTVVRGAAIGVGFTLTAHSTFLYCSPEARFMVPFMKSA